MFRTLSVMMSLFLCCSAQAASRKKVPQEKHDAFGFIVLNGEREEVRWSDGDSFTFRSGPRKGMSTRLKGYNTLEAYGPVHQWGSWKPAELFALAKSSSRVAASREWECTSEGKLDGYRRLLVNCRTLAIEMVRVGHALAYAVEGEKVDSAVLSAQAEAMKNKRGMWGKGISLGIVTSVHSLNEDVDATETYNRVIDTRTGKSSVRKHAHRYESCQMVCEETEGQSSCMLYVPFKHRYRSKAACLLP